MKQITLFLLSVFALCSSVSAQSNRFQNISTYSDELNVALLQQHEQTVQLSRYLFAGYNSICLPLTLDAAQLQAAAPDVRIERFAAMRQEGNTLQLYFLDCTSEGIEAGVPYLIYSPKAQNLRIKNTDATSMSQEAKAVTLRDAAGNAVTFSSSWKSVQALGRYGIPAKQDAEILESVLVRTDGQQTFLPTRCGFSWEAQAPGATELQVKHISELSEMPTGIESLVAGAATADIYDANGVLVRKQANVKQALQSLPRGIYIIGDEKVSVK